MLALQISINGQVISTAGTDGTTSIHFSVSFPGQELRQLKPEYGPVVLRLGGMSEGGTPGQARQSLNWLDAKNCALGDEITVKLVEVSASETDSPEQRDLSNMPPIDWLFSPKAPFLVRLLRLFRF